MRGSRIAAIANRDAAAVSSEKLKVSFKYIDLDAEEFFFHGLEDAYYKKFFECVNALQDSTETQIAQQTHPSLSPKSIFNSTTSIRDSFPGAVVQMVKTSLFVETRDHAESASKAEEITRRAFEVRLGKNYGRLHGFLWNNTFHVVWIDPAHNLFPMGEKVKKHRDAATVRCYSPDECLRLQEQIRAMREEIAEYEGLFAEVAAREREVPTEGQ